MTLGQLLWRNLWHFRATNLAVLAGMAVATAVLAGALMVGDSVRGSLRALAVERLGPVDHALVAGQFFGESLAKRIKERPGFAGAFRECVAGVRVRGRVAREDGAVSVAGVQVMALGKWMEVAEGQAVVNEPVGERVGTAAAIVSVPRVEDMPRESALARRGRADVVSALRVDVTRVMQGAGMAELFSLEPSQRTPRNAWVNLRDLQRAVGQPGRANMLLVSGEGDAGKLNEMLAGAMGLEDYGLKSRRLEGSGEVVLTAATTYLMPTVEAAVERAATKAGVQVQRVSTHLLGELRVEGQGGRAIHYAIVAGLDRLDGRTLGEGEVAINAWTAEQLGVKDGAKIRFTYYQRQADGSVKLAEAPRALTVAAVLPMKGLGADPTLTPEYKGLTDADAVHDWSPPAGFPFDQKLVTSADEAYWSEYRAAPKVFVSLATARELWGREFGGITSIRIPAAKADAVLAATLKALSPAEVGMSFVPVRQQQLAAAAGSTDFSMLFVGFSFFLIIAATLLVAMLFGLGVEQRARQFGLLAALGFAPRRLSWLALAEGGVLAAVGGLIGLAGAIGYTWLMVAGLRTWWVGATGTRHLSLHVEPGTLAIGWVASVGIAVAAMWWAARKLRQARAVTLLVGTGLSEEPRGAGRIARGSVMAPVGLLAGGLVLLGLGIAGVVSAQVSFMAAGGLLLAAGLTAARVILQPRRGRMPAQALWTLALHNTTARPGRSLLVMALIALASFILVTVGAMRQGPRGDPRAAPSGTGGFALILHADIPLLADLNTRDGRRLLGIRRPADPLFAHAKFTNLRLWQGQDISCLNMTRPMSPRIIGVPEAALDGRFVTAAPHGRDAFALLREARDPPQVIADGETAAYILHTQVGSEAAHVRDQAGRERPLVLAATLAPSIFQSELLMSERTFRQFFPLDAGFGMVLIDVPDGDASALARLLETELDEYGVTVTTTAERLAAYRAVANTYLSTFETLGSLGLLLGTVGMAVVLLRNIFERRAELALLAAVGFAPRRRMVLVLAENAALLVLGLGLGTLCALIATVPAWRAINVPELSAVLAATLAVGLLAQVVPLVFGLRRLTPTALRAE